MNIRSRDQESPNCVSSRGVSFPPLTMKKAQETLLFRRRSTGDVGGDENDNGERAKEEPPRSDRSKSPRRSASERFRQSSDGDFRDSFKLSDATRQLLEQMDEMQVQKAREQLVKRQSTRQLVRLQSFRSNSNIDIECRTGSTSNLSSGSAASASKRDSLIISPSSRRRMFDDESDCKDGLLTAKNLSLSRRRISVGDGTEEKKATDDFDGRRMSRSMEPSDCYSFSDEDEESIGDIDASNDIRRLGSTATSVGTIARGLDMTSFCESVGGDEEVAHIDDRRSPGASGDDSNRSDRVEKKSRIMDALNEEEADGDERPPRDLPDGVIGRIASPTRRRRSALAPGVPRQRGQWRPLSSSPSKDSGPEQPSRGVPSGEGGNLAASIGGWFSKAVSHVSEAFAQEAEVAPPRRQLDGRSYFRKGRRKAEKCEFLKAVALYNLALVRQREELDEDHVDCATTLNEIGVCWMMLGERYPALSAFEEALYIRQKKLGVGAMETAETTSNIWQVLHEERSEGEQLVDIIE